MAKKKSLIKNVIYNFVYTGINLLFPIITAPYVSNVLGAGNLGNVNFATAVVNWFIIFAVFGTSTYGVREVAKQKNNHSQLSKLFNEIVSINAICTVIVLVLYYITIFSVDRFNEYLPLFLILSINIVLNMLAIDWFFQGIEEYRYITIRNGIVKIISLICLLLFVREPDHYILYGLISVLANSLNGILNFTESRKYIEFQFRNINPLRHFKALSIFFIHSFIVNIYTNLDQVLLGFFSDARSVAFLNRCKMLTTMAISLSTAISNVTLPRASYYLKYQKEKFLELLESVPDYIMWITIPIAIGLASLAPNAMYILGGEEFLEASGLLQIMSITIIFSPLSTYLQYQVLVALGKERIGLLCAMLTSIISLVLNLILIPKMGFLGAGIVQVISEITAVTLRYYIVNGRLGYKGLMFINGSTIRFIIAAGLMGAVILYIRYSSEGVLISFFMSLFLGILVYVLLLFLMKEKITITIFNRVLNRLKS